MKSTLLLCCSVLLLTLNVEAQQLKINKNPVIAHRGAWKTQKLPENSIAALKEAVRLKCYGSEFDVHQSADGVLVVNHDHDYQGMVIANTTYAELKKHPLPNGEEIPTLENYLKVGMKQRNTKLILEIKPVKDPQKMKEVTDASVAMVQRLKAQAWVEYISFSYACLQRILELDPKAIVAYLNGDASAEKVKQDGFAGVDYHYKVYKNGDWFNETKKLGLTLNAWTVNDPVEMQWLIDQKAEYITTNEPELLFEVLKKQK
ncbi:glycerophosphoryl diester phosphodiesterase [Pedobacter sp. CAN_A7]|uniref:glycerophosphodiester phosphodiesterase n=1 Tax=Pedobacter sp. CAN_A7 TaxID=2787722 RepID=UPI0018C8F051